MVSAGLVSNLLTLAALGGKSFYYANFGALAPFLASSGAGGTGVLKQMGNAFTCAALFLLGFNAQGTLPNGKSKLSVLKGRRNLVSALFLIMLKTVLLPIVMRYMALAFGVPNLSLLGVD